MRDLLRTTWLLFRTHLGRTLLSKRMGFCLLVALGPAVLAWIVNRSWRPPDTLEIIVYPGRYLLLQLVVPILALIAGSAVISEEVEDRTITYLFSRPIPRASLLLGRWLATAVWLCAILAGGALLLTVMARTGPQTGEDAFVPPGVIGPLVAMAALGGAVYSALFATLGTFLKHPMIVGLGYTFAIEAFLANLPGKSQALTIQFYLRSYLFDAGDRVWQTTQDYPIELPDPAGEALTTLVAILVVSLVVGSVVVSRRQYLLSA